ncbi:hypothetical protein PQX77_001489, partial [Marasmius sp. AFHP31]
MFHRGEAIDVSPPLYEPCPAQDPTVVDHSLGDRDILDPYAAMDTLLGRPGVKGPPLPEDFSVPPDTRVWNITVYDDHNRTNSGVGVALLQVAPDSSYADSGNLMFSPRPSNRAGSPGTNLYRVADLVCDTVSTPDGSNS